MVEVIVTIMATGIELAFTLAELRNWVSQCLLRLIFMFFSIYFWGPSKKRNDINSTNPSASNFGHFIWYANKILNDTTCFCVCKMFARDIAE